MHRAGSLRDAGPLSCHPWLQAWTCTSTRRRRTEVQNGAEERRASREPEIGARHVAQRAGITTYRLLPTPATGWALRCHGIRTQKHACACRSSRRPDPTHHIRSALLDIGGTGQARTKRCKDARRASRNERPGQSLGHASGLPVPTSAGQSASPQASPSYRRGRNAGICYERGVSKDRRLAEQRACDLWSSYSGRHAGSSTPAHTLSRITNVTPSTTHRREP